jgi:hypothetical protein
MAVFWNDTFTEGGSSVGLTSHTPETGGSYSYLTAIDAGTSATVNATTDRCEFPTGTFTSGKPSASPGTADYTVSGNCRFNDSTGVLRVYVRVSGSDGYCGEARLDGTYNIYRVDSGSFTSIVSGSLSGLSGFTNYAYSFGITGSSLSMTFNGTTISVSNSTYTAAGAAAIGGRGVEVDNVSADDSSADTTPPTLTSATGTGGVDVCSGTVSTDEANGTLYAVATASATQPSIAQIKAGQDHTSATALRAVSQSVTATGTQTISSGAITGGAGTRYFHYLHTDAASNNSNRLSSSGFSVTSGDTTAPTLTSATGTGGAGVCSGTVSTNEGNGTLYAVATDSATQPSVAQIKAGQDHTGTAALRAVSQSVTATGTQTIASGAISGGAGTRYWHFLHTDAAANDSNRISSAGFSVTSGGGPLGVTLDAITDETGAVRASYVVEKIWAVRISDNTLVATWTSQTTNGSGVLPTLTNASLTAVPHAFVTYTATGLKAGAKVYTPA